MGSHQKFVNDGNKQVRVDNWGVFFLNRLQAFFNKTDYCDLTLQFEGNVQLKVHRLVINACTEYFHILEQTCEMVDDVLMMPADLQADVILPIVNFMYTGMLEFHTSVFDKLYKTANLMNITVLTKLLDAQRAPPKMLNKKFQNWKSLMKKPIKEEELPAPLPGRKIPVWKRKSAPTSVPRTSVVPHFYQEQKKNDNLDNAPKPTRFEWPEDDLSAFNSFDSSFDEISYTSKPLVTQKDEPRPSTSFDRIRDSVDTNQQATSDYENLDIDLDDVRDYVKEQKIRSSINMHVDEDQDIDNDFDSDGEEIKESQKRKQNFSSSVTKRVRFNPSEKENQIVKKTKINITPTGKTNSDVDHTKLISEVLKKYPNLVKKNKNIRLKILAKSNVPTSTDEVKKTSFKKTKSSSSGKTVKAPFIEEKNDEEGSWKCLLCSTPKESVEFVLYYLYRKHMTDVHNEKFDSRMCKYCGHKSAKYSNLVYHQYTRHCIKPPPAYIFPKCSKCPYIALNDSSLIRHKINHTSLESQCMECKITFSNNQTLTSHTQITGHNSKSSTTNYDCQYCIKKFPYGTNLFAHIRLQHLEDARRDGIVSVDELEEELADEEQQELFEDQTKYMAPDAVIEKSDRIKIIQDVKLPAIEQSGDSLNRQNLALEPSSEAEALSNVASGIATSLGLVDVVVLDDNQQYILHTENQPISNENEEYIIPDMEDPHSFTNNEQEQSVITQSMLHSTNIGSTDELVMVLTDHDYGDENNELINNENSKIVVLYSHPIGGTENQFITSQGNLMLTSQAGLIELRNGNTVVTSTASHFLTTNPETQENAQIESIEMIQREIDQHPDVKDKVRQLEADSNETNGIQNVTENINQNNEDPTVPSMAQNGEAVLRPTIIDEGFQMAQHLENVSQSSSLDNNTIKTEKSSSDAGNSQPIEHESSLETSNVLDNPSYASEEPPEETSATVDAEIKPDVHLKKILNEETEEEKTSQEATKKITYQEVTNETTSPEESEETSTNETQNAIPEQPTDESVNVPTTTLGVDVSKSSENESSSVPESTENVTDQITETANTTENIEANNLQAEPENKTTDSVNIDFEKEDVKPFSIDHFRIKEEAQLREENAQIEAFHLPLLQDEVSNSSEIQDTESQDESHVGQDNLQSQTEDENSQPLIKTPELEQERFILEPESLSSEQENISLEQENISLKQENTSLEQENLSMEQESCLERESSNLEQDVPSPNLINNKSVDVSKRKSNQSAKVILADWDDTDSQQSDSKSGTNVNKLIDDWDDDDDDKKDTA